MIFSRTNVVEWGFTFLFELYLSIIVRGFRFLCVGLLVLIEAKVFAVVVVVVAGVITVGFVVYGIVLKASA